MSGKITLRSARREEAQDVLDLWARAGSARSFTDTVAHLEALIDGWPDGLIVACDGATIVGSVIWDFGGWRAHFYRLAVDPAYRRRGLGRSLVAEAERRALAVGADRVNVIVEADKPLSMEFWHGTDYEFSPHTRQFFGRLRSE